MITFPFYEQRKKWREENIGSWRGLFLAVLVVALIVAIAWSAVYVHLGLTALIAWSSVLLLKFWFTEHASDIERKHYEEDCEWLDEVSSRLYELVEKDRDANTSLESERFYSSYFSACSLRDSGKYFDFHLAVQDSDAHLRAWTKALFNNIELKVRDEKNAGRR